MASLDEMEEMNDNFVISSDMIPLCQMGLEKEIFDIFKVAEKMILNARRICDDDINQVESAVKKIYSYIENEYNKVLSLKKYDVKELEEQMGDGYMYVLHVALTGEVPVYDSNFE